MTHSKPILFAPVSSPAVRAGLPLFEAMLQNKKNVEINVPAQVVNSGNVYTPTALFLALQHFPTLIEGCIFNMRLKFTDDANPPVALHADYWKQSSAHIKWLFNMSSMYVSMFFLDDREARLYNLIGDVITTPGAVASVSQPGKPRTTYTFTPEQATALTQRFAQRIYFMLMYCHGCGFNVQPYIEILMAEIGLPINFDVIHKKYMADVAAGVTISTDMGGRQR